MCLKGEPLWVACFLLFVGGCVLPALGSSLGVFPFGGFFSAFSLLGNVVGQCPDCFCSLGLHCLLFIMLILQDKGFF